MSKSDILAVIKEVEGQILAWNQNIRESMKYIESQFADFHSISISAAATIPSPPRSPPLSLNSPQPLPKNDPAPPKQTPSQLSSEELIKKIEAKIAANVFTPPPQIESSTDTQVATTVTSVTDLSKISREEQQTTKSACRPEMCGSSNAYKVFDELIGVEAAHVAESGAQASPVVFTAAKPCLVVEAPKENGAVQFYKAAFEAEEVSRVNHPKRKMEHELPLILSAELKLGSSIVIVSNLTDDSSAPVKSAVSGTVFCLETEDVEAVVAKAVAAGTVFEDELTERNSSSPRKDVAAKPLREKSYIFVEEKKTEKLTGDSSTNKIGYMRKMLDKLIHRAQVNMKEKWANLHIVPAATLTGYFEKKGVETPSVFDPGGSAFDVWVREVGNSLFDVFHFSCFKMKWISTKVHDWMHDSFSSYCDTALKYLLASLRMNIKVVWCKVVTKSIALGVVGCNICWVNEICLVLCFKNVPSVLPLPCSLTDFNGTLVELSVWRWLKDGNGTCLQTDRIGTVAYKLQLPPTYRIHPVFHVALLKLFKGYATPIMGALPDEALQAQPVSKPMAICGHRVIFKHCKPCPHLIVQWSIESPE